MIEALWYGVVASLSFIGLMSIIFYILLHTCSPSKYGKIIIDLNNNLSENELYNAFYGLYLQNVMFGNIYSNDIVIISDMYDASLIQKISDSCGCFNHFKCMTYEDFLLKLKQEE